MNFHWRQGGYNPSPFLRAVQFFLLVLIVIGVGLLLTRKLWVPKVVAFLLNEETLNNQVQDESFGITQPTIPNDQEVQQVSKQTEVVAQETPVNYVANNDWQTYTNNELGFSFKYPPFENLQSEKFEDGVLTIQFVNFAIVIQPKMPDMSLKEFFVRTIDPRGYLTNAKVFVLTTTNNMDAYVMSDVQIPPVYLDEYGPLTVSAYIESLNGRYLVSFSMPPYDYEGELLNRRYTENAYGGKGGRERFQSEILQTISFLNQQTPKSHTEAIMMIKTDFGYTEDFQILYEAKDKIWFKKPHETEGCNRLIYFDMNIGRYVTTDISACSEIDFLLTTPLYVNYCWSFAPCFDGETLKAVNLDTLESTQLFSRKTELQDGETLTKDCFDGNYGKECRSDISAEAGTLLRIGVFLDSKQATSVIEYKNSKIRDIYVDLKKYIPTN